MQALGLIEVNGYLAAVEAADAALKAANVHLLGVEIVKAGISTVEITGDVGAVKASVDTGAAAAEKLGLLRSVSVIPRLHEETLKIIPEIKKEIEDIKEFNYSNDENKIAKKQEVFKEDVIEKDLDIIEKVLEEEKKQFKEVEKIVEEKAIEEVVELDNSNKEIKQENKKNTKKADKDYAGIKVEELRRMVRKLHLAEITNKEIKFAKKDLLIKILLDNDKEGDK